MLLSHARTLCDARSALALLSDQACCLQASSAYEHVLITLDAIHGNDGPAIDTDGLPKTHEDLATFAKHSLKQLRSHGVDALHVELMLAMLFDAIDQDVY